MMLLGLVLHTAITYGTVDYGSSWMLKDPNTTHVTFDAIVALIHSFRMQIFFLIAGFFGALLFYERSPARMIKNRIQRIGLPFLVFLFVLWPSIKFAFTYTDLVFSGAPDAWQQAVEDLWSWSSLLPTNTFHLWFLYDLIHVNILFLGFAFLFIRWKRGADFIKRNFIWVIKRPLVRLVVLSLLTGLVYYSIDTYSVPSTASFIPNYLEVFYYSSFYAFGWVLFKAKEQLDEFKNGDRISLVAGIALFFVHIIYRDSYTFLQHVVLQAITVWLLIFGIMGCFIRYGSQHSYKMRYISDSSYWVYLIHLSFVAFFPGLMVDWPIPAVIKLLIVVGASSIICWISYHYLVRSTFIGKFLNGRKYPRKG
ncbi:acyltransferase family protein [bacterium SCSIO 12741]|nr:acyltransferase family protein [bacterium SCSIO 12741]